MMFILPDEGMGALSQSDLLLTRTKQLRAKICATQGTQHHIFHKNCLKSTDAVFYVVVGR
jgi:hypothetical protein